MEYQVQNRLDLARGFSCLPWRYSPVCNVIWWIADCRSEIKIRDLEREYLKSASASDYVLEGPGWRFATPQDLHRHLVALWKNSSIQLDKLCAANGIRYHHFLQPNLLIRGSKPLTATEQHMASSRDKMYRPGVNGCYPLMIEAGRGLQAGGERFTDLTQMFAGHPEAIFADLCHLNQAGNHLLADRIAEAIVGRALVSSAAR